MDSDTKPAKEIDFSKFVAVTEPSRNMTGVAGEYFVCGELCRINILALLTPKNNPLFDVIAMRPGGDKSIFISVKTMGVENNQGWRLGMDLTKKKGNPNLFVVLVNLKVTAGNDYYVFLFDELVERVNATYSKYIEKAKRDGTKRKDLNWRWLNLNEFSTEDRERKNKWYPIELHLS